MTILQAGASPPQRVEPRILGNHRLYGPYRSGLRPGVVRSMDEEVLVVEGALATTLERTSAHLARGGVFAPNGDRILIRQHPTMRFTGEPPCNDDELQVETEDAVYLGPVQPHFGHFLLEVLPRLWFFREHKVGKAYVHPWVGRSQISSAMAQTLSFVAGGDLEVNVIQTPTRFRRLYVPSLTFHLQQAGSPQFAAWCRWFAESVAAVQPAPSSDRIYYSRVGVHHKQRAIADEPLIEALFARRGFEIVRPQTLSFFEQVARMKACRVLAGCEGSAMHQALFMPQGSTVAVLDYAYTLNQHAIERMCGHTALHFRCLEEQERLLMRVRPEYIPVIETAIDSLLQARGP